MSPAFAANTDPTVRCAGGICTDASYRQPTAAEAAACAALSDGGTTACSTCASGTCVLNALIRGQCSSDPREPETILLEPYGCGTSPCIDPIFGPTASNRYWSSSFSVPYAVQEWAVEFLNGGVEHL